MITRLLAAYLGPAVVGLAVVGLLIAGQQSRLALAIVICLAPLLIQIATLRDSSVVGRRSGRSW